jgi:hypothetical protein
MIVVNEYRKDVKEIKNTGTRRYYAGSILMVDENGRCVDATYVDHYGAQLIANAVIDGVNVAILIQDVVGKSVPHFFESDFGKLFWVSRSWGIAYVVEGTDDGAGSRWRLATCEEMKGD